MLIQNSILKRAIKSAEKSPVRRGKVSAVLFSNNGHIITQAYNATFMGSDKIKTIHAEQFLLMKAYRINAEERYGKDLNVLVIRWKPGVKELANARPCPACQRALDKTTFNVYYSNEFGEIVQQVRVM